MGLRRRWPRVGSWGAAALLLVAGSGLLVACSDDAPQPAAPATDAAVDEPTDAPPPVDRSQAHLWLGAEEVPPDGGDLPVVIVDPTSAGDTWGVAAEVDRWDGAGWVRHDAARVCMDFWGCVGQIGGVDAVEAIGLSAAPVGPLTWLGTDGLDPGWYRLTQTSNEGTVAAGQFEVRAGAPAVPEAEHEEGAHLVVEPTVLFSSDALRSAEPAPVLPPPSTSVPTDLTLQRDIAVRATSDLGGAPRGWQDGRTRIERWDGDAWVDASDLQLGGVSTGIGPDDPVVRTLDDPPPGAYRVLVDPDAGADPVVALQGRFWVTDLE